MEGPVEFAKVRPYDRFHAQIPHGLRAKLGGRKDTNNGTQGHDRRIRPTNPVISTRFQGLLVRAAPRRPVPWNRLPENPRESEAFAL